jgi:exosortase A-associated hydrolase 2
MGMDHFYFGDKPKSTFGVLTRPTGKAHTGVVFSPPFGEEMVATYARFARWAKELATQGFAVLRYHPRGTGESEGGSKEFTLKSATEDAAAAVRWMRECSGCERVGIFGLRFGASVVALADTKADFGVLWSPVTNLRIYFRDLLRLRLTKELIHQRADHVKVTAKDLTAELDAGRSIDLLGYEACPELYRQMIATEAWPKTPPASDVLWLDLPLATAQAGMIAQEWRNLGSRVDVQTFREKIFWEDFSSDFPHQFAEASISWMVRLLSEAVGTS